jgi:hypothetical protein
MSVIGTTLTFGNVRYLVESGEKRTRQGHRALGEIDPDRVGLLARDDQISTCSS